MGKYMEKGFMIPIETDRLLSDFMHSKTWILAHADSISPDSSFEEKENLVAYILQHCRHMGDILAYAERYTGGQIIDRMECTGSNQEKI